MKRYWMDTETYDGSAHWSHPVKDREGDWVRYEDVQAEIARLHAEVERLSRDSYSKEWAELRFIAAWEAIEALKAELAEEKALADDLEKVAHGVSWDHPARTAYRKARGL